MSDFFMWGGLVYSVIWHFIALFWNHTEVQSPDTLNNVMNSAMINVGLSGVSLCYFGMQAFK